MEEKMLTAEQVLVTIGTPCSLSAVGSTETYQARVSGAPEFIAFAAFDAGLVDFAGDPGARQIQLVWAKGPKTGSAATLDDIEREHGAQLRAQMGIRSIADRLPPGAPLECDIAACLPHDWEDGGVRPLAGLTYRDIRDSALKDMYGLFDDDPRLGPSLQAQLFAHTAMGALAALPKPLAELLASPYEFRVAAATAFQGLDALTQWLAPDYSQSANDRPRDRFAVRLASSLSSHGPALISTMLSPAYSLSRSLKNPSLLDSLRGADGYMRVPQTPLTAVGACASSSIAFSEVAPQLLFDYPGYQRPKVMLWSAADAGLQPNYSLLEAFGSGALMTRGKLDAINADRAPADRRSIHDCLAPFDIDANGTVVGHAGSGLLITTLDFALRNFLDITSIIVGWGQSGETGGKAHFAGVGFGGENAIIHALTMAHQGHGYGSADFGYLAAHATGTRTNSKADLNTAASGRKTAAEREGFKGPLPQMIVGTPKAVGDGHSMGETGLKATSQALQYVLGQPAVAVPTLRNRDPDLGPAAEWFELRREPVRSNGDAGALCATQGFGGYNGAIALRSANADAFKRYRIDPSVVAAYLERWPQVRQEREQRERFWRRTRRSALQLAEYHRWLGAE
jgi:3-oxoacyl-[acyl-carrier-protein] synthase II